jgi:ABC-type transport system involved in multi-copper enzyme maturation permease subunit
MTVVEVKKKGGNWFYRFIHPISTSNPITVKELRGRMRGRRAFVILTAYLLVMSSLIVIIYSAIAAAGPSPSGPTIRQAGKYVFGAVVGVQVFLILFVGPALTAGAISGEKERKTYELLRTTLLSSRRIVTGKLLSALSYVLLLVLASVPLQSAAYLMGGITVPEVVISQLLIVVAAVAYAMIGLFISSIARTTLVSSVGTYSVVIFLTFGIPLLVGAIFILFESIRYGPIGFSYRAELMFTYFLLMMAALNLPASLVVSEIFLLESGSLIGYESYIASHRVFIISPWYLTLIFYGSLSILLLFLTIRRVKRVAIN